MSERDKAIVRAIRAIHRLPAADRADAFERLVAIAIEAGLYGRWLSDEHARAIPAPIRQGGRGEGT